jgi:hypothetical protein
MAPSDMDPPVVLVEVGASDYLPDPVVTKDDRVTLVSLTWKARMEPELVAEARAVLEPIRSEHPRFAWVLDRLDKEYPK